MPVVVETALPFEPPSIKAPSVKPESKSRSRFGPNDWRYGLVEAFPIPEDRKSTRAAKKDLSHIEDAISSLSLSPPHEPFPFFDLPSEIRNRIYDYVLFSKPAYRGADGTRKSSRLACMLASKRMHNESAYILYTTYKFNIFPLQLFETIPTVQELPPRYRSMVANLQIVVGESWTNPPKSWRVSKHIARLLKKLEAVQTLKVFVQLDPSLPWFQRYRKSETFYTDFCGDLLGDVLEVMPQLKYVELDGNRSVDVNGPLVRRLKEEAEDQAKIIKFGKDAGWAYKYQDEQ